MTFDPRVHVGVAVFAYDQGEYSYPILKRADDATHGGGTWGLPGGWIDYGETPEEAARRELKEELNITRLNGPLKYLGSVTNTYEELDMHVICLFYKTKVWEYVTGIKIMEPEKHTALSWVTPYYSSLPPRNELFPPLRSYLDRLKVNYG